jgi:hypothetical protein
VVNRLRNARVISESISENSTAAPGNAFCRRTRSCHFPQAAATDVGADCAGQHVGVEPVVFVPGRVVGDGEPLQGLALDAGNADRVVVLGPVD